MNRSVRITSHWQVLPFSIHTSYLMVAIQGPLGHSFLAESTSMAVNRCPMSMPTGVSSQLSEGRLQILDTLVTTPNGMPYVSCLEVQSCLEVNLR